MTARELIYGLPDRLKDSVDADETGTFHFDIIGETGGEFTVSLANKQVTVTDGFEGVPSCIIKAKEKVYVDVETGKKNAQMAVMMGQLKISDISEMMKFIKLFKRLDTE